MPSPNMPTQALILLLIITSQTLACSPPLFTDARTRTVNTLSKRWYSYPLQTDSKVAPWIYPWPLTCSDPPTQTIRYCFGDARSASNLQPIVDAAVANWLPASHAVGASTMSVEADLGCPRDITTNQIKPGCLCSETGVAVDALKITDITKDGDDEWNDEHAGATTTSGYAYIPEGEPEIPWRHFLQFGSYEKEYDNDANPDERPKAVRDMTHEFGHAMGLLHEHQRPDRNFYIHFRCSNLRGFDEAVDMAEEDSKHFFRESEDIERRMARICSSWSLANFYFPELSEFLDGDQFEVDLPGQQFRAHSRVMDHSREYDYDSIMGYPSTIFAAVGSSQDPSLWTLWKKDRDRPEAHDEGFLDAEGGNGIWPGGGRDGRWGQGVRITEGDVARVAQLYPCHDEEGKCERARTGEGSKDWESVNGWIVRMRGEEGMEVRVPKIKKKKRDEI